MARQLAPEVPKADGELTGEGEQCPLCEFEAVEESTVYVHLQTCHRKSQIAKAVLDSGPSQSTATAAESRQLNDGQLRPVGDSSD